MLEYTHRHQQITITYCRLGFSDRERRSALGGFSGDTVRLEEPPNMRLSRDCPGEDLDLLRLEEVELGRLGDSPYMISAVW